MSYVTSADGTRLAVETVGSGPPLVLVVGALSDRTSTSGLAELLGADFTVSAYDRRGRGDSGNADTYDVARELDDLDTVLAAAGPAPVLYGHSTGAILALRAVARGAAVSALAAYEPPWDASVDDPDGQPSDDADLAEQIGRLVADGENSEAVQLFLRVTAGLPPQVLAGMAHAPFWPRMTALAPTLLHDIAVTGDQRIPVDALAAITVPTLVVTGGRSDPDLTAAARATAAAIPGAELATLDGQGHAVDHAALAPVLREFFRG